jgi:hypothetical protein
LGKDWIIDMARLFYEPLEDDVQAAKILDNKYPPGDDSCYYEYPFVYGSNMYFGFYAHENILKLVDEINNNFKNIKVVIIGFKEYVWESDEGAYTGDSDYDRENPDKYTYCLFRVELDESYSKHSRYTLQYIFAQFLRGYCPEYSHFRKSSIIESNFIDGMIDAQNTSMYGAWMCCRINGDARCERKTFDSLDNIEYVNELCDNIDMDESPSISDFFERMENETIQISYRRICT